MSSLCINNSSKRYSVDVKSVAKLICIGFDWFSEEKKYAAFTR